MTEEFNIARREIDIRISLPNSVIPEEGTELDIGSGYGRVDKVVNSKVHQIVVPDGDPHQVTAVEEAIAGLTAHTGKQVYRLARRSKRGSEYYWNFAQDCAALYMLGSKSHAFQHLMASSIPQAQENESASALGVLEHILRERQLTEVAWKSFIRYYVRAGLFLRVYQGYSASGSSPTWDDLRRAMPAEIRALLVERWNEAEGAGSSFVELENIDQLVPWLYHAASMAGKTTRTAELFVDLLQCLSTLPKPKTNPQNTQPPVKRSPRPFQGHPNQKKVPQPGQSEMLGVRIPGGIGDVESELTTKLIHWIRPALTEPTDQFGRNYRPARSGARIRGHRVVKCLVNQNLTGLFVRKRPFELGGAVCLDLSGSMSPEQEDIQELARLAPGSTVFGYVGHVHREGADTYQGYFFVFAEGGQRCPKVPEIPDGGNKLDFWALEHLLAQPGPRIFVTDGHFCGGPCGQSAYARKLFKKAKQEGLVTQVTSIERAIEEFRRIRRERGCSALV